MQIWPDVPLTLFSMCSGGMTTVPFFNLVHVLAWSPVYGLSPAVGIFDLQVAEALKFLFAISTE